MPTRPTKGDHGTADAGSKGRGGQKATQGSAVSEDVAEGRRDAGLDDRTDPEELDPSDEARS
jgi:hypothetical protein